MQRATVGEYGWLAGSVALALAAGFWTLDHLILGVTKGWTWARHSLWE